MLTKKEKLLIYPYQIKRYYQHRRNIQNIGPAIDFHQPTEFPHIAIKLKKLQKESERQEKVNKDNIKLLQRLGNIMATKRIKNFWEKPIPKFLGREKIPHLSYRSSSLTERRKSEAKMQTEQKVVKKIACSICSGRYKKSNKVFPDERIPWRPMEPTKNMKLLREANIEPHTCCKYCC
ncbi:hypothetical protein PVAND_003757 [Polypedilum vanderplanki]|uniref:Uncharacterized protein n=1 Tax=Polypedilum vanderplanki TaxID=319348 RepID=A0A9J6BV05_POLVA|nr:hypothetical protein PVAND_003757 [Polypedilum vanderplanki]